MFPQHCKEVSLKRVSFPLTKEAIKKNLIGRLAYKKTKYIALNNDDDWAIVGIVKSPGLDLFRDIEDVDIISLPDTTTYLEDDEIDVLSPTRMAEKAEEVGTESLILKGKFEHISFIHKEKFIPVTVGYQITG